MRAGNERPLNFDLDGGTVTAQRSERDDKDAARDLYSRSADWPLFIRLFGEFGLFAYGMPFSLNSPKGEMLIANLALEQSLSLGRAALRRRLWPDCDERRSRQAMNSLLYKLRKLSEEALDNAQLVLLDSGYYRLNEAIGIGVDALLFERFTREASHHEQLGNHPSSVRMRKQALALYRGELTRLVDDPAESVLTSQREHLHMIYLDTVEHLMQHHCSQGEYTDCLTLAQLLLQHDPLRETGHRALMRCYVLLGQRSKAFRQYLRCVEVLEQELGAVPERETQELDERIRQDPESIYKEAENLPVYSYAQGTSSLK